ncbi:MAG: electron transfer flavoprotein subunit beta/FixA family protein [Candidatus Tectomicrobia bacterium]|uniref:Electron transfer flavoprotein subunit beta/FixA family protein n=1 Tax=Tectimicrobiota bacterium TaxID=2528274 RepID=A0A933GQ27_UNCTE|nr:electron transfer flavoprotein subunit beta/FixA family protein [Candidatus Tectomicrobia bacterium]
MSLKIIVCVKPVPDPSHWSELSLDPVLKTLKREGIPSVVNHLDKHALEEALRIKESLGAEITAISMAPPWAKTNIKETLAMGADRGVLLSDQLFAGSDTLATARVLAEGIKKLGHFDLILMGNLSLDGSTGQVGPQLAELLGLHEVTLVKELQVLPNGKLRLTRKLEAEDQAAESNMPLLITVVKEINTPRYTSLLGILEAEQKEIIVWNIQDLGIDPMQVGLCGSPTQMADIFMPELKRRREVLQGEPAHLVTELIGRLKDSGNLNFL